MEIPVLHRQGQSIRSIAHRLGVSRNTVRRYLRSPELTSHYKARSGRASKLDPHKGYLLERIEVAQQHWISATVLFRELKGFGYSGGISILKAYIAPLKRPPADPVVRFETDPGHQLQADFTTIRRGRSSLKAFVATLGFSRASFVWLTPTEHQSAFP